ncbi:MAG TPA: N-acyl homoserine lactonase family protein [Steroidobacteraceae bacterium]|jgi:glyoxylase-like metal-dependent hydrolase (beta-lactamase superfamily II)|nr:N-acyl homoserine lactonase family protein [Steroidobacteraceae bacterium]
MSGKFPSYEVFAIRYATRDARRPEHFIGGDPHDTPMPMDYFVWLVKGDGRAWAVDTGFTAPVAERRKRRWLRCPSQSLSLLGVDPNAVEDVVITHLHYDHVGNFDNFPRARFHLQEREMAYATGRYMKYGCFAHAYEPDDVLGMVRLNFAGRVDMHDGAVELAPGLTLHPTPGHTAGLQAVRVHTARGWLVLASDSSHYFENMATDRPFPVTLDVGRMLDSFRLVESLAESPDHIIPGHDPLVMQLYAPPRPELEGIAVRLDVAPKGAAPRSPHAARPVRPI